jgi:hypothetical protein
MRTDEMTLIQNSLFLLLGDKNVEEFIGYLAVLFVILCGFGIMLSPTKWDPFLLTRPMGRYAKRLLGRTTMEMCKTLKRWTKVMWGISKNPHQSPVARLFAAASLPILGVLVALLAIPADIIGSGKK